MHAAHSHEVHVVECEFAQFRHLALYENGGFLRIEAGRKIVKSHLYNVLTHLLGVIGIVGERLCVGDHDKNLVKLAGVLQFHTPAQ